MEATDCDALGAIFFVSCFGFAVVERRAGAADRVVRPADEYALSPEKRRHEPGRRFRLRV